MKTVVAAALLAGAVGCAPASALTINLLDPGLAPSSPAAQDLRIAARYWESVLANKAVVNLQVNFADLGANVFGSTWATNRAMSVESFETALATTGTTALDAIAIRHLPRVNDSGSLNVTVPAYGARSAHTGVANHGERTAPTNGSPISAEIGVTNAEYKALVGTGDRALNAEVDGRISFSSDAAFDFNPSDGVSSGKTDFIAVAVHEIGHALGFQSGADDFDSLTTNAGVRDQSFRTDAGWWGYGGDLFRYSADGDLNWSFDQNAYFSIDGGATAFDGAHFSTGEVNGDGWQASHWLPPIRPSGQYGCWPFVGIMNPYFCTGRDGQVTADDLAFLDAIGWNPSIDVLADPSYDFTTAQMYTAFATPEPETWLMLALGFAACGAAAARRRRRARRSTVGAPPDP